MATEKGKNSNFQGGQSQVLISIIITNYNYASFLSNSVDSALGQNFLNTEIIVVDDGSTDNSMDLLKNYEDKIKILSQENLGQTAAFNLGFFSSTGDLVIFLDSDDVLYPHCLDRVVALWQSNFVKAQYRLDTIDADGHNLDMPFPHYSPSLKRPGDALNQVLSCGSYSWPVSSGNVYARRYLEKVMPLAQHLRRAPDGMLNRLAPLHGQILIMPEILAAYRVHSANILAQLRPSPEKYSSKVAYEIEREPFFREKAAAAGYNVRDDLLLLNRQHLETRILSLRLNPLGHPASEDSLRHLVWLGLKASCRDTGISAAGKGAWILWFIIIWLLPTFLLTRAIDSFRMQGRRSSLARKLLLWLRRSDK